MYSSDGSRGRQTRVINLDQAEESDEESIGDRSNASSAVPSQAGDTCVPSSTVADHAIEKLVIENNIFLKAALQLLDQRDHSIEEKTNSFNEGSSADVIMCGTLLHMTMFTVCSVTVTLLTIVVF
jgi:hypothetical protein